MANISGSEKRRARKAKKFLNDTKNIGKRYFMLRKKNPCLKAIKDIERLYDAVKDAEGLNTVYLDKDKITEIGKWFEKTNKEINVEECVKRVNEILKNSKTSKEDVKDTELNKACGENKQLKERLKYLRGHFKKLYTEIRIYTESKTLNESDKGKERLPDDVLNDKIKSYLTEMSNDCTLKITSPPDPSSKNFDSKKMKAIESNFCKKQMNRLLKLLRYFLVYDPKIKITSKKGVRNKFVDDDKFIKFCIDFEKSNNDCENYLGLAFKISSLTNAIQQSTCKEVKRLFNDLFIKELKSTKKLVKNLNDANNKALTEAEEKTKKNNA